MKRTSFVDIIGVRYKYLVVLGPGPVHANGRIQAICACDCGNVHTCTVKDLKSGNTKSCGCKQYVGCTPSHGHTMSGKRSSEFRAWEAAKQRCTNPQNKSWNNYGGRGIKMDPRWIDSFESFLAYIGPKPHPGWQIDREDVNGNYEPGNVRWVNLDTQSNNRRGSRTSIINGVKISLKERCRMAGVNYGTVCSRLQTGLDVETALTKPIGNNHGRNKKL